MSDLKKPRYLIYTPTDDILVSESFEHRISCLLDTDHDGFPDQRRTVGDASNGLNRPFGMAFANGFLYVSNVNATRRYLWNAEKCQISGTGEVILTYPSSDMHWTRTIVIPPSADKIYVAIGADSDVNAEYPPLASVQQANINGSNQTTLAYGLRNPVGLSFHPITQDLYVTCNERNDIGDDLVPDFFTRIQQNDFFGWPFAYLTPNLTEPRRCLPNGTSERPDLVALTKTPDVLFQAHLAPLGMQFYTGKQFPDRYRNGAFVATRGSQNRVTAIGNSITFVPFDSVTNRPTGYYEDFVTGFLTNPNESVTFGRPVGLLVLKDGSLIFTDDVNNQTYQVQYNHNPHCYSLASITFLIACNYLSIFIIDS
jgi:glucose/arabinose dehydrogenase